jgi:hypothetical protein
VSVRRNQILNTKIENTQTYELTCFVSVEFDLTVRDEERFSVLENTLLREISKENVEKVTERWGKKPY